MAGKTLDLMAVIKPDRLGTEIANTFMEWNILRQPWLAEKQEVRSYIYATDTTKTTNSKLPWKNKTTIPKLCQISDNLYANYMMSIFPKKKWLTWDGDNKNNDTKQKRDAISAYMCYTIDQPRFKNEWSKCVRDIIEYGNFFVMPEWVDNRITLPGGIEKVGYVGPVPRRISPLDIVFNPTAPSFEQTPKIVRSLVSIGEVKQLLESYSSSDDRPIYEELYKYLLEIRGTIRKFSTTGSELVIKDSYYNVDGFTSFQLYLQSNYCELLYFYGDIYDSENDEFLKNQLIIVVDRHKIIWRGVEPSGFSSVPIFHVGWRLRQDNLWAMGPLDNLVGMQYRIDHIENLKADCFDLIVFPPLKIKGYVSDFEWGPMARIYVGDNDGDVEMMAPHYNVLQANQEIQSLMATMEEMAGAPKEAMGFRTPGEKTKYEVQRLENAASRIFQNQITVIEEMGLEPYLNASLELSRRKVDSEILVKYFDDEAKINTFLNLTPDDISGAGRIRPFAARHFAEQAEIVQNLTNMLASPLGQIVAPHYSSIKLAKMMETLFDITDWGLVMPYVTIAEQADAQRFSQVLQEKVLMEGMTASGLTPDDSTEPFTPPATSLPGSPGGAPVGQPQPPGALPRGPLGGGGY